MVRSLWKAREGNNRDVRGKRDISFDQAIGTTVTSGGQADVVCPTPAALRRKGRAVGNVPG